MERRGILIPTIAVIIGLIATGIYAVVSGTFPVTRILPTTALGVALIALFGFSYLKACRAGQDPH